MKQKLRKFSIVLIFSVVFLSACASSSTLSDDYILDEKNKLIIYTSHKEEVYGPVIQ